MSKVNGADREHRLLPAVRNLIGAYPSKNQGNAATSDYDCTDLMPSLLALDELKAMEMGAGVLVDSIREVRRINGEGPSNISAGWCAVVVYPDEDRSTARIGEGSDVFDDFDPVAGVGNFKL